MRRRPGNAPTGPLFQNLRVLHIEYYDSRKFYVTECFPYLAGSSLDQLHLQCNGDAVGAHSHDFLDLSRVIQMLSMTSPKVQRISIQDNRERQNHEQCKGLSILLGRLKDIRQYASCMTIDKSDISNLAAMPNLTFLSAAFHMGLAESPFLSIDLSSVPIAFQFLETLVLNVRHVEFATGFIGAIDSQCLRKLRLTVAMWHDENTMERCLSAIARQSFLRDISITVSAPPIIGTAARPNVDCTMTKHGIMRLFSLSQIQTFCLNAHDDASFETDLDDNGIIAMATAWTGLRSLTIVQGSWAPQGVQLPPTRITMASLLALRDHCPNLVGISISLDTTNLDDIHLRAAACANRGDIGTSLRKLNIGARSTAVSNHSICAQVLKGLFPRLTLHDGANVDWDQESSDWQEVGAILRKLKMPPGKTTWVIECSDVE